MDPTRRRGPTRWFHLVACLLPALSTPACSLPRSPTMAAVPPEWRHGNPFGPEANAARANGTLGINGEIPRAEEWTAFAKANIATGDILFRRGQSCTLTGNLTSLVLAAVNDGRFSHIGIAKWEGEQLWIYDVETEGVRKVPFVLWMLDVAGNELAIKRLHPEYRDRIPKALAFCDDAYQRHVEFNFSLSPDDQRYYCSEMVEKAFRSAGLQLSEPVKISRLPGYNRCLLFVPCVELYMGVDVNNSIFALGNEHYGTFASPFLELVYEGPEADKPERGKPEPETTESE